MISAFAADMQTQSKKSKIPQKTLDRLKDLAATSYFVQGEHVATPEDDADFEQLLQECLAQGMTFDGLEDLPDDGCPLCFEEKKQIVYEALSAGKGAPSKLRSIRVNFDDLREDAKLH